MGFFRWLYRLPGRIDRSIERTAIASAVVQSEGPGQVVVDPGAMNAALGEMQANASEPEAEQGDGG